MPPTANSQPIKGTDGAALDVQWTFTVDPQAPPANGTRAMAMLLLQIIEQERLTPEVLNN
jgi:hypothetical protein